MFVQMTFLVACSLNKCPADLGGILSLRKWERAVVKSAISLLDYLDLYPENAFDDSYRNKFSK